MNKTIRFSGHIDDILHVETDTKTYEYSVDTDKCYILIHSKEFVVPLKVHVYYDSCWSFGIGYEDELEDNIDFELVYEQLQSLSSQFVVENEYCVALELIVPHNTQFRVCDDKGEMLHSSDEKGSKEILLVDL